VPPSYAAAHRSAFIIKRSGMPSGKSAGGAIPLKEFA